MSEDRVRAIPMLLVRFELNNNTFSKKGDPYG